MDALAYQHFEPSFKEALESPKPFEALCLLAQLWVAQGVQQAELYAAFEQQLQRYSNTEDQQQYDALADTMDLIVGWCAPEAALFKSVPKPNVDL